jgi:hypothetical protein
MQKWMLAFITFSRWQLMVLPASVFAWSSPQAGGRTCLALIDYRSGHNRCQLPSVI